jgi:ribosomal protein S18 acetylase RimI-like enzyme
VTARAGGAVLAAAFRDDPLFAHVLPDPRRRAAVLPHLFTGALRHSARHGGTVRDGGGADGGGAPRAAAGWVPLARARVGALDAARCGTLLLPLRLGAPAFRRFRRHEAWAEDHLFRLGGPGVAYLWVVGVLPTAAGLGLGREVVDRARRQARAGHDRMLLKTERPTNPAFYRRLGFRVVGEAESPAGVRSWFLEAPLRD